MSSQERRSSEGELIVTGKRQTVQGSAQGTTVGSEGASRLRGSLSAQGAQLDSERLSPRYPGSRLLRSPATVRWVRIASLPGRDGYRWRDWSSRDWCT